MSDDQRIPDPLSPATVPAANVPSDDLNPELVKKITNDLDPLSDAHRSGRHRCSMPRLRAVLCVTNGCDTVYDVGGLVSEQARCPSCGQSSRFAISMVIGPVPEGVVETRTTTYPAPAAAQGEEGAQ